MGSLFEGSPQKATSYVNTTSDYPKWMQDAIFNQVQLAQNVANRPFQSYDMPTVAELSPLQQQAYKNVVENQGAWKENMDFAQSGMKDFSTKGTADALRTAQADYLRQGDVGTNLDAANQLFGRSAGMDVYGAAQPYLSRAGNISAINAANPYLQQSQQTTAEALSDRALNAANPYLNAAAQSSVANIGSYMSPFQQGVMDVIAKQGARNLSENLLPNVSDAFIRAGLFGSSRMGEFGSRALRDTQEAILNQQAQAAQQGYAQALGASQADLARQAQLAGTVGSISGADLSRVLQGAGQYQNIGQTAGQLSAQEMQNLANIGQTSGQLTSQQMQNLGNLAQARAAAGQAQQTFGLNAAQAAQAAQAADYQRQMSALSNVAEIERQTAGLRASDVAALEGAGVVQQGQMQNQLNAAKAQVDAEQLYPKQQADWLSTQIRGLAPITPQTQTQAGTTTGATYSPSPLSQISSGFFAGKATGLV